MTIKLNPENCKKTTKICINTGFDGLLNVFPVEWVIMFLKSLSLPNIPNMLFLCSTQLYISKWFAGGPSELCWKAFKCSASSVWLVFTGDYIITRMSPWKAMWHDATLMISQCSRPLHTPVHHLSLPWNKQSPREKPFICFCTVLNGGWWIRLSQSNDVMN